TLLSLFCSYPCTFSNRTNHESMIESAVSPSLITGKFTSFNFNKCCGFCCSCCCCSCCCCCCGRSCCCCCCGCCGCCPCCCWALRAARIIPLSSSVSCSS